MRVAIGSLKGSPGVTTLALALAAAWPGEDGAVLVECDPDGGDLASRWRLPDDPGLVTLAAATRNRQVPATWLDHSQELPGGQRVIVSPAGSAQVRAALPMLAADPEVLPGNDTPGIFDCGRIGSGSPAPPLWLHADAALVIIRAALPDLAHLAARREDLQSANLSLVLAPSGPYRRSDVENAFGLRVLAELPRDDLAGAVLCGRARLRARSARRLGALPLMRAARRLAVELVQMQAGAQHAVAEGRT